MVNKHIYNNSAYSGKLEEEKHALSLYYQESWKVLYLQSQYDLVRGCRGNYAQLSVFNDSPDNGHEGICSNICQSYLFYQNLGV